MKLVPLWSFKTLPSIFNSPVDTALIPSLMCFCLSRLFNWIFPARMSISSGTSLLQRDLPICLLIDNKYGIVLMASFCPPSVFLQNVEYPCFLHLAVASKSSSWISVFIYLHTHAALCILGLFEYTNQKRDPHSKRKLNAVFVTK